MPGIAVAGTKIQGLGVNGDNAQGIASGGNVIFRSYVPVGTVLWSGGKYFKSNTNITLAKPISQLKTGIVINVLNSIMKNGKYDRDQMTLITLQSTMVIVTFGIKVVSNLQSRVSQSVLKIVLLSLWITLARIRFCSKL